MAYYTRGCAHAELGEPDKAVRDYDEIIRLNPDDPYVRRDRQLSVEQAEADGR